MSNYPFAGQWICAPEFAGLAPLSLFHREMQPLPPVSHPEALKNVHVRVEKTFDAAVFGQAKKAADSDYCRRLLQTLPERQICRTRPGAGVLFFVLLQ